jgi:hypothetical protein
MVASMPDFVSPPRVSQEADAYAYAARTEAGARWRAALSH